MSGATGLDYTGVRAWLDENGFEHGSDRRRETFECIQAAELATLDVWHERRLEQERNKPSNQPPGF